MVTTEGFFFKSVEIKVTVYYQAFVAMEVFIILEHLMHRKQIELVEA